MLINSKTSNIDRQIELRKNIIETIIYMVVSIAIILCIRTFVVQHVKVDGTSMDPTLVDGEHLLIEKLSYKQHDVERFDIIVFSPYEDMDNLFYVKRVIGLPNEKIKIENGIIYINGEPLEEDYGNGFTEAKEASQEITIGEDQYFVLGDNRGVSKDSREEEVGLVSKDSIMGKAWTVIWPFSRLGLVEHK